ncbi:MAG: hypothetical protein FWD55_03945 [Propionibacteriaceae bacterium]|nr:hypothetical protein [Propionibacteriaceae bacterium]
MERLSTVAPGLTVRIVLAPGETQRAIAISVARQAASWTELQDSRVESLLTDLEEGRPITETQLAGVGGLIAELDGQQWNQAQRGEKTKKELEDASLVAYHKARAAASVLFAADPVTRIAALEATYEAYTAMDEGFQDVVTTVYQLVEAAQSPEHRCQSMECHVSKAA